MVKNLMKRVARRDAREPEESRHGWELDVLPVGSVADGSKILLPDEFDFLVVFRRFRPGDKLVVGQDYTYQVEKFRMHLVRCMQEMDGLLLKLNPGRQQLPPVLGFQFIDCELRRICLNIRLTWWGTDATSPLRGLPISVDLTPVFQFQGWDNQSGFRPLRSLASLPDWFIRQPVEHFRPVTNTPSSNIQHDFICLIKKYFQIAGPQYSDSSAVRRDDGSALLCPSVSPDLPVLPPSAQTGRSVRLHRPRRPGAQFPLPQSGVAQLHPGGGTTHSMERRRLLRRRNLPKIHSHRLASQHSLFRLRRRDAFPARAARQGRSLVHHLELDLLFLFRTAAHNYNAPRLQYSVNLRKDLHT